MSIPSTENNIFCENVKVRLQSYFVPFHLCQWVDCKDGQAGQVGVVEAAGGVGGVVGGDGEHLALRLRRPVGGGEREPIVSAPI